jgi:hypothetical protein
MSVSLSIYHLSTIYLSIYLSVCLSIYLPTYLPIYHSLLIHSSVIGHLGCFHSLAIVNSAVVIIGVQVFLSYPDLHPFGYMSRSGITGSCGSSICSLWRTLHIAFHSCYTNLQSQQQCIRVPISPHPHQHLLVLFLKIAILTGMRWNLRIILICISLWSEKLNTSSCTYWPFVSLPLKIPYSIHVPIYSLGCWFFGCRVFWAPCRFCILVSYQMNSWQRFFPFCGQSLQSRDYFFWCAEAFSLMQSHLFILSLNCWAIGAMNLFRKSLPLPICSSGFPTASYSCFKVLGLMLRPVIHFELILVQMKDRGLVSVFYM